MRSDAHFSLNKLFPTALFVVPRLFLCSVKFNNAESRVISRWFDTNKYPVFGFKFSIPFTVKFFIEFSTTLLTILSKKF